MVIWTKSLAKTVITIVSNWRLVLAYVTSAMISFAYDKVANWSPIRLVLSGHLITPLGVLSGGNRAVIRVLSGCYRKHSIGWLLVIGGPVIRGGVKGEVGAKSENRTNRLEAYSTGDRTG
jgi:hypothetical protein